MATPMIPARDDQLLEVLPNSLADSHARELRVARIALTAQPQNLPLATQIASEYLEIGRATGDPRYTGYAQSALATWWQQPKPPPDVLLLRAGVRQRAHQFDAALLDLNQILTDNPRESRALLQRATIRQVTGNFAGAWDDCIALTGGALPSVARSGDADSLVASHCRASVMSVTGQLDAAYALLEAALNAAGGLSPVTAAWALTTLGEMAERRGRSELAEQQFNAALSLTPDDQYLLTAYADFLLAHKRADEVIRLTKPHVRADGLLLRYAIALHAQNPTSAANAVAQLRARYAASAARQDVAHKREEARFALALDGDATRALALAQTNWAVQKEPADLRILVACARRTNNSLALAQAREWLAKTRLEDRAPDGVARLLANTSFANSSKNNKAVRLDAGQPYAG